MNQVLLSWRNASERYVIFDRARVSADEASLRSTAPGRSCALLRQARGSRADGPVRWPGDNAVRTEGRADFLSSVPCGAELEDRHFPRGQLPTLLAVPACN